LLSRTPAVSPLRHTYCMDAQDKFHGCIKMNAHAW
jgi:hypothetical protein